MSKLKILCLGFSKDDSSSILFFWLFSTHFNIISFTQNYQLQNYISWKIRNNEINCSLEHKQDFYINNKYINIVYSTKFRFAYLKRKTKYKKIYESKIRPSCLLNCVYLLKYEVISKNSLPDNEEGKLQFLLFFNVIFRNFD